MVMIVMSTAYAVVELILLVANVIYALVAVSTFLHVKVNISQQCKIPRSGEMYPLEFRLVTYALFY